MSSVNGKHVRVGTRNERGFLKGAFAQSIHCGIPASFRIMEVSAQYDERFSPDALAQSHLNDSKGGGLAGQVRGLDGRCNGEGLQDEKDSSGSQL